MGFNFNRKYTQVTKTRPELSSGRRFRLVFEGVRWQNARPVVVGAALIGSYRLLGPIRWRPRPTSAFVIRPRKGKLLIMQPLKQLTGNQPNTLSLGSSPLHKTRDVHASPHTCRPATGAGMAATTEDTRPTSLDQHNRKCIVHHYCYVRSVSPYSLSLR